jgi:hypothetical protein
MRIRKPTGSGASPLPGSSGNYRNGKVCPRCKRFGTYAPNSIVCDRCTGALPLIFVVTITVRVGGDR